MNEEVNRIIDIIMNVERNLKSEIQEIKEELQYVKLEVQETREEVQQIRKKLDTVETKIDAVSKDIASVKLKNSALEAVQISNTYEISQLKEETIK